MTLRLLQGGGLLWLLANPDNSGSSGAGEELGICEDRTDGDVPSAPVDSDGAGEQGLSISRIFPSHGSGSREDVPLLRAL